MPGRYLQNGLHLPIVFRPKHEMPKRLKINLKLFAIFDFEISRNTKVGGITERK